MLTSLPERNHADPRSVGAVSTSATLGPAGRTARRAVAAETKPAGHRGSSDRRSPQCPEEGGGPRRDVLCEQDSGLAHRTTRLNTSKGHSTSGTRAKLARQSAIGFVCRTQLRRRFRRRGGPTPVQKGTRKCAADRGGRASAAHRPVTRATPSPSAVRSGQAFCLPD
jgi:hypothetical protein